MATPVSWLLMITLGCSTLLMSCSTASAEGRQLYIVYMGDVPKIGVVSLPSLHSNILQKVVGSGSASKYLVRSYKKSFNGFVAELTKEEAKRLSDMKGVVSVLPNKKQQLLTTRSWDFMGFSQKVKRNTTESDIVIGVLDSGIWPESASFSDDGLGPAPKKWKGTCQRTGNFTCNNKIIGARYYRSDGAIPEGDFESARDGIGHGTHTASTAAGIVVEGASMLGVASGTARGGVPSARIAAYKICWSDGCYSADILAAFDDAIADGVDVISLSVGSSTPVDYFHDPIAIGAFHSMKNGVLTSNSAGNSGPQLATVSNCSPWSLSVAASTIDRKFLTRLTLGNKQVYEDSISINTFKMDDLHPLILGADAPNKTGGFTSEQSRLCSPDSLDKSLVKGKIVFCESPLTGGPILAAGAAGTIFPDEGNEGTTYPFPVPTSVLDLTNISKILEYINSSSKPVGKIERTNIALKSEAAPVVASFSSRGPSPITLDLLTPDITAPGVQILAAWSEGARLTDVPEDKRVAKYNIISGTSMACPHASAAAAYVKSFHPSWSPASIKSALMTTATPVDAELNPDQEFAYGAGQINPEKAINPGLVYNAGAADFVRFLCGQGYSSDNLRVITGDGSSCTKANNGTVWDLNIPTFSLSFGTEGPPRTFTRTVTNVGSAKSTYRVKVTTPPGLTVKVAPTVLRFSSLGQKRKFKVRVTAKSDEIFLSGSLVWDDGFYKVRSPIVAFAV